MEQLYPLPYKQLGELQQKYSKATWFWVQEEPQNMGAWNFIRSHITDVPLELVSRLPSGSPAVGLSKLHLQEQQEILGKVFRLCDCELKNKYCGLQCKVGSYRKERKAQHELI